MFRRKHGKSNYQRGSMHDGADGPLKHHANAIVYTDATARPAPPARGRF
jgi:hypothetical protein